MKPFSQFYPVLILGMAGGALALSNTVRAGITPFTDEGAWASSVIPGTIGNANFSSAIFAPSVHVNTYATTGGGYTVAANSVNLNFNSPLITDVAIGQGSYYGTPDGVNVLANTAPTNNTDAVVLTVTLPQDVKAAGLYWGVQGDTSVTMSFYENASLVYTSSQTLPGTPSFSPFFGVISTQAFNHLTVTAAGGSGVTIATPDVQYANVGSSSIPEPASAAFLGAGAMGLLLLRKRGIA